MQASLCFTPFVGLSAQKVAVRPRHAQALSRSGTRQLTIEAKVPTRREQRDQRHRRIRGKVEGTEERPRLAVYRSNTHIYAQVIDDAAGSTLAAASTLTPEIREKLGGSSGGNVEAAKLVGLKIAEICKERNIEKVCFDRGGYKYHGRVQALADAAREGGLEF